MSNGGLTGQYVVTANITVEGNDVWEGDTITIVEEGESKVQFTRIDSKHRNHPLLALRIPKLWVRLMLGHEGSVAKQLRQIYPQSFE